MRIEIHLDDEAGKVVARVGQGDNPFARLAEAWVQAGGDWNTVSLMLGEAHEEARSRAADTDD